MTPELTPTQISDLRNLGLNFAGEEPSVEELESACAPFLQSVNSGWEPAYEPLRSIWEQTWGVVSTTGRLFCGKTKKEALAHAYYKMNTPEPDQDYDDE